VNDRRHLWRAAVADLDPRIAQGNDVAALALNFTSIEPG
jgi:hypothetical protein